MNGLTVVLCLLAVFGIAAISIVAARIAIALLHTRRHPDPNEIAAALDRARRRAVQQTDTPHSRWPPPGPR